MKRTSLTPLALLLLASISVPCVYAQDEHHRFQVSSKETIQPIYKDPVDPAQYRSVKDIISLEDFEALAPIHRKLLVSLKNEYNGSGDGPFVCFSPGYPIAALNAFERSVFGDRSERFRIANRWTTTASGPVVPGEPFTLTYSFVPDGTDAPGATSDEPSLPSDLVSFMDGIYGSPEVWQGIMAESIERWGEIAGINYVFEANDDGAAMGSGSPGVLGVRGDIRIAGRFIDGESGSNTLAFNFFPNNGDMVIDTTNPNFYGNTSQNSLNLRNTIGHEHGHGLGFFHVCPVNQTKLMEPNITRAFDGPQIDEVAGVHRNYGDNFEPNNMPQLAHPLGELTPVALSLSNASTDDNSDVDYYSFTVPESGRISITLTPEGASYLEGPQGEDGCSDGTIIDTRSNSDLIIELLESDGTGVILSQNESPAGQPEIIDGAILAEAGTYFLRVKPDQSDDVQLYSFTASFNPESGFPESDLAVTITDGLDLILPGSTVIYTITARNNGPSGADNARLETTFSDRLKNLTSWSAVYEGGAAGPANGAGDINMILTAFPQNASVTINASAITPPDSSAAVLSATSRITAPISSFDPISENNEAIDETFLQGPGRPNDLEDFNSFQNLTVFGNTSPNDIGSSYQLDTAPVSGGFQLESSLTEDGRGLTFQGPEVAAMFPTAEFDYVDDKHMLALRFFYADDGSDAANTRTEVLAPRAIGGQNLLYLLELGKDFNGTTGLGLVIPTNPPNSVTGLSHLPLAANTWHTAIVQFASASDSTQQDAAISLWVNPTSPNDPPDLTITAEDDFMSSIFGNGPLGSYRFGNSVFQNSGGGPTVIVDRIATWDGFGTPGINSLEEAIEFINNDFPPVPTTAPPTTVAPTTVPPTTVSPTTVAPTTVPPTTVPPTTVAPTTVPPTATPVPTNNRDTDRDGLSDDQESLLGTLAGDKDTDNDGIEDGVEVAIGTDPLDPDDPADKTDADADGIPDAFDNNPNSADADGDRFKDFYELAIGSDPQDSDSIPSLGDANESGAVLDFVDAVIIFNIFLNNLDAADYAPDEVRDLNRDGSVDFVDGVIAFNFFLNNIPLLPLK